MNIVLINPEFPPVTGRSHGGIATYTYVLANALSRLGNTVHVLVKPGTTPDTLDTSVMVHTFNFEHEPGWRRYFERAKGGPLVWEKGLSRGALQEIRKIHTATPVDIVEIPEYNGLAYAFMQTERFAVVINFHTPSAIVDAFNQMPKTPEREEWYRFEESGLAKAKRFRCPSEALKRDVCSRFNIPEAQVTVIRNPVDADPYDRLTRTARNNQTIDLLFAGRLERRKGAEIMLRAVPALLSLDPRITITFAGQTSFNEGPNYQDFIEKALSLEQRKRVWFLGPVGHDALPSLYCRCTLLLYPSIFDNAPNVLLEAMASRLPIVASDIGGVNEIIHHDKNGLLFDTDSIDSLTAGVKLLMDDPALRTRLSDQAYADMHTHFSPETIAQQSIQFYKQAL